MTHRLAPAGSRPGFAIVAALRAARAARRSGARASGSEQTTAGTAQPAGDGPEGAARADAPLPPDQPKETLAAPKRLCPRRWVASRRAAAWSRSEPDPASPRASSRGDCLAGASSDASVSVNAFGLQDAPATPGTDLTRRVAGRAKGDAPAIPGGDVSGQDSPVLTVTVAGSLFSGLINRAESTSPVPAGTEAEQSAVRARADAEAASAGPMSLADDAACGPAPTKGGLETQKGGIGDRSVRSPGGDRGVDVALTVIPGLGPGVSLRLARLGYRTIADLSRADPETLKQALGEISRLLDVEQWIAHARALSAGRGRG